MKTVIWDDGYTKYTIGEGFGCWAQSKENNNIPIGTTRYIKGLLMYLYSGDYKLFKKSIYSWVPVDKEDNTWEKLESWVKTS